MKYLTRNSLILLSLLSFSLSWCQTGTSESNESNSFFKNESFANFKIGGDYAIPIGNTFTGDNLDSSAGFSFEVSFNLNSPIIFGFRHSNSTHDVKDKSLVGNYSTTHNRLNGLLIGYQFFTSSKVRFTPTIGVGKVSYRQSINGNKFYDSGTALWINGEVSFHFTKWLALYGNATLQKDYLNMDVPSELEDYFKYGQFLRLGLGIKFVI